MGALTTRFFRVAGYLLPLLLWWAGARLLDVALLLPPPEVVLRDTLNILASPGFLSEVAATTMRALAALAGSALIAVPLGMIAGRSARFNALLAPTVLFVRAVPFISIILIAVIWFSSGTVPVFVAVLMVFPILYEGGRTGVRSVDPKLTEMTRVFRCRTATRITHLWIPGAMPTVLGSLRSAAGIAWKVTVAAEVLSVPVIGIGTRMGEARLYLETERVLAWTLSVIVLAGLTDRLINFMERHIGKIRRFVAGLTGERAVIGAGRPDAEHDAEPDVEPVTSIRLRDVTFSWPSPPSSPSGRDREILRNCSLSFSAGSVTALIGPSGVGKTTLLSLIAGTIRPERGSIIHHDRSELRPGMVFQEPRLLPWRTVEENLSIVGRGGETPVAGGVTEALRLVHLEDSRLQSPDNLSGGMQQRVNLARALYYHPDVLLVDEPLSGVDQAHRVELSAMLRNVITLGGVTTILSSHDLDLVYAVADRILLLEGQPVVIALDMNREGDRWSDDKRLQIEKRLESSRHTLRAAMRQA